MSLSGLLDSIRKEQPEDENPIHWVEVPEENRVVSVAEVQTFQQLIAERDLARYQELIRQNRPWALILVPLSALLLLVPGPGFTFLSAMYAVQYSSAWFDAWGKKRRLERNPEGYFRQITLETRYTFWMAGVPAKQNWPSWALAGSWVALFILQLFSFEASLERAALLKPLVHQGEFWRLMTGPMLHGNIMHILMNAAAAYSLGLLVGRTAHRHLLIPIWLIGAFAGSLASLVLMPKSPSVGASGGVMALIGFLAVMARLRRALLPPDFGRNMMHSIFTIGFFGLLAWQVIDNAAHAGGLAAGAAIAWLLFRRPGPLPLEDKSWISFVGWAALIAFLALTTYTVLRLLG